MFIRIGIDPSNCIEGEFFRKSFKKIAVHIFGHVTRWNDSKSRKIISDNSKNGNSICIVCISQATQFLFTVKHNHNLLLIRTIGRLNSYLTENDDIGEAFKIFYLDIGLSVSQIDYLSDRQRV